MGRCFHNLAPFLTVLFIVSVGVVPMPLAAQTDFVRGDCLGVIE